MGTKSPAEIIESALVAHLQAQSELTGVNIERGIETDVTVLPLCVVSVSSLNPISDLPEWQGNFNASLSVTVFTSSDEATALTVHRARTAAVLGALQDIPAVKALFTSQADATCYDVIYTSTEESQGDRALLSTSNFSILIVLPA
jgi:hypothetical protein